MRIRRWMVIMLLVGGLTGTALADTPGRASGPAVELVALQLSLQVLGYDPGPIDGRGGPRTLAALGAYAQDRGIALNQTTVGFVVALIQAEIQEKLPMTRDVGGASPHGTLRRLPVHEW